MKKHYGVLINDAIVRPSVRFIDDPELAYVMTRYRQVHDFWHVLSGLETDVFGEIALKWFEFMQTGTYSYAKYITLIKTKLFLVPDPMFIVLFGPLTRIY